MSIFEIEHNNYLKLKRKEKVKVTIIRILIIVCFLIIWEICARFKLINTFLFSSPSNVVINLVSLSKSGELFKHIFVTLYEVLLSFGISGFLGISIAFLLWKYPLISRVVDPYLTILNSLPKVALGPLIIIWVGASINSIIFMALMISSFVTIINIYNGFINTDSNYITLMKSFNTSDWILFKKVIFPSNLKNIISAMKVNISMSLIGLLPPVGENLNSNKYYSKYLSHYL